MGICRLSTISCSTLIYLGTISRIYPIYRGYLEYLSPISRPPSWSSWYILYYLDTIDTISCVSYSAQVLLVQYLGILDNLGTISCGHLGLLGIYWVVLNFEAQYLARRPSTLAITVYLVVLLVIWVRHLVFSRLILNILGYPDYPNPISWVS